MTLHVFFEQFLAAIEPAFIGMCIALLVVGTLSVYNWGRMRGLQVQVNQQSAAGAGGRLPIVVTAPPTAGAGKQALLAPVWNQLDDVLPDAQQDPYASTDCGEESTAMAVAACGGPDLPAGVLRQLLGNSATPGTSTAQQLCYLLSLFKVKAHPRSCPADVAWTEWQHSFEAGFLVIALGWWVTDGMNHWVLIRAIDDSSVTYNDPWGGVVKRMSKGWAQMKYAGWYVHIDQTTSKPAPTPP